MIVLGLKEPFIDELFSLGPHSFGRRAVLKDSLRTSENYEAVCGPFSGGYEPFNFAVQEVLRLAGLINFLTKIRDAKNGKKLKTFLKEYVHLSSV